jgi:hypothetical protein
MRFLVLLAVLAGCKSAPVQYEMIEVSGEKLSNMRGPVQRKGQAIVLEMHDRDASEQRPGRSLLGPCRAIPRQEGILLATSRTDAGGGATAERSASRGDQTTNAGVRLPAGD